MNSKKDHTPQLDHSSEPDHLVKNDLPDPPSDEVAVKDSALQITQPELFDFNPPLALESSGEENASAAATEAPSRNRSPRKTARNGKRSADSVGNSMGSNLSPSDESDSFPHEQTTVQPMREMPASVEESVSPAPDMTTSREEAPDQESSNRPPHEARPRKSKKEIFREKKEKQRAREAAALDAAPSVVSEGIVEISAKGFGFLREKVRNFNQSPKDVFITPEVVRVHSLRDGLWVKCVSKEGVRGPQLIELLEINGKSPAKYQNLPYFEELTAINPAKRLTLETINTRLTTRVIDLISPIGRGQRGLIVAPPRTGKTTLLHHIAEAIQENYKEMHLMILLVDERPEEVTDFQRSFPKVEVLSSSNDSDAKEHTRIALLAIERAKRLVEAGEHVFILMDSITRLARAFNNSVKNNKGRGVASGGITVGALEMPRRIFAAARNTREAGSLTIVATALIQTNSKADEAIFQEFKGTGNMEIVLDRQLSQNYIYPAIDINKSGTRREELLLPAHMLEKIYVIRRGLSGYKPLDSIEWLLRCMQRYQSNAQMLMDVKKTALS